MRGLGKPGREVFLGLGKSFDPEDPGLEGEIVHTLYQDYDDGPYKLGQWGVTLCGEERSDWVFPMESEIIEVCGDCTWSVTEPIPHPTDWETDWEQAGEDEVEDEVEAEIIAFPGIERR